MTDQDIINTLLEKIFYATSAPDIVTKLQTPRRVLAMCSPGIPLPVAALDFGFATMNSNQVELAADFSYLVNNIPVFGSNWTPTGKMTWGEYEKALTNVILPNPTYSPGDVQLYQNAK
jgi:hypothetical protein